MLKVSGEALQGGFVAGTDPKVSLAPLLSFQDISNWLLEIRQPWRWQTSECR